MNLEERGWGGCEPGRGGGGGAVNLEGGAVNLEWS